MKQNFINTINMLPQNEESFTLLKEMCLEYMEEVNELKEIINNKAKADLLKEHNKTKPGNIELRFQEDAINAMYDEQDDYHTGFQKGCIHSSIYGGNVLQQRNPKHDDKLFKYIDMVSENEEYWRSPKLYLDQPDHILIIIYKVK